MKPIVGLLCRYMRRCRELRRANKVLAKSLKETARDGEQLRQELSHEQSEGRRLTEQLDVAKTVNELLAAEIEASIERERLRAVVSATKRAKSVVNDRDIY